MFGGGGQAKLVVLFSLEGSPFIKSNLANSDLVV